MNYLDDTLTALADPTRRRVVELLRRGPRRAGDIAAEVGMSRQAMSRHLNVLRARGIVDVELVDADGRGRTYRLRGDRLVALSAWLDQVQAGHAEQLAAFRRYAEERAGGQAAGGGPGDAAPDEGAADARSVTGHGAADAQPSTGAGAADATSATGAGAADATSVKGAGAADARPVTADRAADRRSAAAGGGAGA